MSWTTVGYTLRLIAAVVGLGALLWVGWQDATHKDTLGEIPCPSTHYVRWNEVTQQLACTELPQQDIEISVTINGEVYHGTITKKD